MNSLRASTLETPVLPSRMALPDILGLVESDLIRVEGVFRDEFLSDLQVISDVASHVRDAGGKRIRPALLLLASRLFAHSSDRMITLGAVVEYIHTATLLHDDVIDEAATRRGRKSANSRWGNKTTVLIGDFLYTKSMAMALTQDNLGILRLLSDVTLRMIEGQVLEIEREADLRVREDQHIDIIRRKTADLFSACMRIGAMLGNASPKEEQALADYGLALGLAFQMKDDLLDFTASEKALGKPVGLDLREGKLTLPIIYMLEGGDPEIRAKVESVVEDRGFDRVTHAEIVALARRTGALARAEAVAVQQADAARAALSSFKPSAERDALLTLPDFILARDH
ncbi:MAG: polyprenyl synthetase family protein [Vicinamibacteria bacterium]|nr:polyprenyl synthetase family protein [Vicinamibacteria bacterium]